jgi:hypothetical protein
MRRTPDGLPGHQAVRAGRTAYLYVRARNRGQQTAFGVMATARVTATRDRLNWPDRHWTTLSPPATGASANIRTGDNVVLGPFAWRPTRGGRYTILVELNAPGDRSNINPDTGLPCANAQAHPSPINRLVRFDNNLAAIEISVR